MFTFYKHLDSIGYDAVYVGPKPLEELERICQENKNCVGFNTLGYLKYNIVPETQFKKLSQFTEDHEGFYVHTGRLAKLRKAERTKQIVSYADYNFYPNMDSPDNDLGCAGGRSIPDLIEIANNTPNCAGFNTMGFLKSVIRPIGEQIRLVQGGLYVKKQTYRIKLLCNWCTPFELCHDWNRMSQGNFCWNDLKVTWEDTDIDLYVIINKPRASDHYVPSRTIVFQMEPWCADPAQRWGVKTWGEWAEPDPTKFLRVRTHRTDYNNCFWQLRATYPELKTATFPKTKLLSTICSSKYFDPGHIKRIDFLKYLEAQNDPLIQIDIYNTDNQHQFKGYKGPHPPNNKDVGMMPYKYYFMGENNEENNFMTEKIWEPLLTETLCFYWGCPNLADYIDPRAYILLDLSDFAKSYNIIKMAIENNEWEKRLEIIRREKQKVLEYYNFFPTLERIIKHELKLPYHPTDDQITYHKYMHKTINQPIQNICFIHSCTFNNDTTILTQILSRINTSGLIYNLDYVYVVNIGDPITVTNPKTVVINYSTNKTLYEYPTLHLLHTFARTTPPVNILYLHTKGSSYPEYSEEVEGWRNYMLHFLVDKYPFCLDTLQFYDTVGCNKKEIPAQHYSGNFWWANSEYIRTLPPIKPRDDEDRHTCEFWLLDNHYNNPFLMYESGINHYEEPYPVEYYSTPEIDQLFQSFYQPPSSMRIKCINLERRPDRKANLTTLLTKANLLSSTDFFPAVDGQTLVATNEIVSMFKDNDFGTRRSFIGCALSHITLWEQLYADPDHDKYLILEDDIQFDSNLNFQLNRIDEMISNYDGYDILYLGYHFYNKHQGLYDAKVNRHRYISIVPFDSGIYIGGFFGYIITKSGASKLTRFIKQNGCKHGIDYLTKRYIEEIGLVQYEVLPHLIRSKFVAANSMVDSDIQYDQHKLF